MTGASTEQVEDEVACDKRSCPGTSAPSISLKGKALVGLLEQEPFHQILGSTAAAFSLWGR